MQDYTDLRRTLATGGPAEPHCPFLARLRTLTRYVSRGSAR